MIDGNGFPIWGCVLMDLNDLGNIGEFVGAVGVVASLIYLAIQIRQNTAQMVQNNETLHMSALESNLESANRIREIFILNPDIAKLYIEGLNRYSELDPSQRFRFAMLLRNIFGALQAGYIRHLKFGSDPTEFENNIEMIDNMLSSPGIREWLKRNQSDWRPEFLGLINERLERSLGHDV
jgi:hypothetical protein